MKRITADEARQNVYPRRQSKVVRAAGMITSVARRWEAQQHSELRKRVTKLDLFGSANSMNAHTVAEVLRIGSLSSTVAFNEVCVIMLNDTPLDEIGMIHLIALLKTHKNIFSVNLGEMPNRREDNFWNPFVEAIEEGTTGVAFAWADAEKGDVRMHTRPVLSRPFAGTVVDSRIVPGSRLRYRSGDRAHSPYGLIVSTWLRGDIVRRNGSSVV